MKAQFWSFDVIFAMIIFGTTLVILAFVWYNVSNELAIGTNGNVAAMQLQLQGLSSRILEPGYPTDWNSVLAVSNTITWRNVSAGLIQSGRTLSPAKIAALEAMANYNYQSTKSVVGVGFDYYIAIVGNSTNIGIGLNPATNNAVTEQSSRSEAVLNGLPVSVQVVVWTNSTLGVG